MNSLATVLAYIVVDENDMITYRDALKPHRGEVAK